MADSDEDILNVPLKLSPQGEMHIDDSVFKSPIFGNFAEEYKKRKENIKSAPVLGNIVTSTDGTDINYDIVDDNKNMLHNNESNPFYTNMQQDQFRKNGGKSKKARKAKKSKGGKSKKARKSLRRK